MGERRTNPTKSLLEGDYEVWPCVSAAGERDGNFSENSSSLSWLDLGDAVVDDVQECFADEAGAGFSWLRDGNKLSGDVRGLSGGTPEACLTDRHEVSSCGPCAPGAQKSWVSLAVRAREHSFQRPHDAACPFPSMVLAENAVVRRMWSWSEMSMGTTWTLSRCGGSKQRAAGAPHRGAGSLAHEAVADVEACLCSPCPYAHSVQLAVCRGCASGS